MRLALIVEYEGTRYHGFQYQKNAPSIQEELENAIARLTGETVRVKGAGRTDAGVHARGQVVAFDTESSESPSTVVGALNYHLGDEIAVKAAYRVSGAFDPRRWALSRKYRYSILNSRTPSPLMRTTACRVAEPLDVDTMARGAELLVGEHDFATFSAKVNEGKGNSVRHMFKASVARAAELIDFDAEANSFLPRQMRRMAGSLVDLGRGALSMDEIKRMINGGRRSAVARTLPAKGLCLIEVTYGGFPPESGDSDDDAH